MKPQHAMAMWFCMPRSMAPASLGRPGRERQRPLTKIGSTYRFGQLRGSFPEACRIERPIGNALPPAG